MYCNDEVSESKDMRTTERVPISSQREGSPGFRSDSSAAVYEALEDSRTGNLASE